jgi:hypothetical protein
VEIDGAEQLGAQPPRLAQRLGETEGKVVAILLGQLTSRFVTGRQVISPRDELMSERPDFAGAGWGILGHFDPHALFRRDDPRRQARKKRRRPLGALQRARFADRAILLAIRHKGRILRAGLANER